MLGAVSEERLAPLRRVHDVTVGALLVWRVYDFLKHRGELNQGLAQEEQRAVLDDIEAAEKPKDDEPAPAGGGGMGDMGGMGGF